MREHTTVAESRISDIEDKLNPLIKDTQSTARLANATELRAEDMENRLRCSNVRFVGLPERVEGRDPTEFVEQCLLEIFDKEAFAIFSGKGTQGTAETSPSGSSTACCTGMPAELQR